MGLRHAAHCDRRRVKAVGRRRVLPPRRHGRSSRGKGGSNPWRRRGAGRRMLLACSSSLKHRRKKRKTIDAKLKAIDESDALGNEIANESENSLQDADPGAHEAMEIREFNHSLGRPTIGTCFETPRCARRDTRIWTRRPFVASLGKRAPVSLNGSAALGPSVQLPLTLFDRTQTIVRDPSGLGKLACCVRDRRSRLPIKVSIEND